MVGIGLIYQPLLRIGRPSHGEAVREKALSTGSKARKLTQLGAESCVSLRKHHD